MSRRRFLVRQIHQIRLGGSAVLKSKLKEALRRGVEGALMVPAVAVVVALRAVRPFVLVRLYSLTDTNIGHFAANTEMYVGERDAGINVPDQRFVDIVHASGRPVCSQQLFQMWKRSIGIWPGWLMQPVYLATNYVPGGSIHQAGSSQADRDVHNLLDRTSTRLQFTAEENAWGQAQLRAMGVPLHAPFICLIVRDGAYEESIQYPAASPSIHTYRNCHIQNFVLASEELARRGYWVIRMGAKVHEAMRSRHPMIIDYATKGIRTDFMDVYLGATCTFCLSTGTGWDEIPTIFRRPIAYVSHPPLAGLYTFSERFLHLTKQYYSLRLNRELTLSEIVASGVAMALEDELFRAAEVCLVESTPEEIRDLAVEMAERLDGTWRPEVRDAALQARFWELFPRHLPDPYNGSLPMHGVIRSRYGAVFLRNNPKWLQ
jgi:putative glycosyltransferase (TIGR04372 family)